MFACFGRGVPSNVLGIIYPFVAILFFKHSLPQVEAFEVSLVS